jgi:hypothetical protein
MSILAWPLAARGWPVLALALLCSGCFSHLYGERIRGADLEIRQRVYVERPEGDDSDTAETIAGRLRESGFESTSGLPEEIPSGVQAIVSYRDHWNYLSGYLMSMRIDFRDPETNELLASGQSYRTDLTRKSPEFMVDEIITAILAES